MEFHHDFEKTQEQKATVWLKLFTSRSPEILSMRLAAKHRPGKIQAACLWRGGAFNICYRVRYEDGQHVIIRFAALERTILRREKVQNEVAVMKYLHANTSIPVPEVLGSGICWAGPYIVIPLVVGELLSDLLKDHSVDGRPVLDPNISDRSLKRAYHEMEKISLESSRLKLDAIGALKEEEGTSVASKRPLTFNMNELMVSATDYFQMLAQQQFFHLQLQQNNAINNEDDCRKKFTARYLFLNLVKKTGVIVDHEFTYTAPAAFFHVTPWWLLLQSPENWEDDLGEFWCRYMPRFHVFLQAMIDCQNELIGRNPLSSHSNSRYGPFASLGDRIALLDPDQQREPEEMVQMKTRELTEAQGFVDNYLIDEQLE
ncbi:uncharacterized protein BO97DRAFT_433271 [Aspergillus homomorphus CBS 101889]|uniref:Aminoglycoside phosphotransferase domain-containing protein n=1 Tax=Aspergillus homomorphus (strain CBS 101889) TaxID=1450537 RepID=A0A395I4Q9_ASPHC|nr:hypothetical protein BO97DRAFT_433271 [Aspergillus homomorphus CBS 101889]RAL14168.1 hypothetical protein BO97DRAFT_433271 [Aspergillus homomorphus CBS 101889]